LGELVRDAQSGFASGERAANGVVQLRMNNVTTDGTLDWGNVLRVPASQQEISKYRLEVGDVLFNSTNSPELVGKTALFKSYPEPVVFSNHFVRLRVDEAQSDPRYLAYWLVAQRNQGVFQGLCTQWVNQAAVRKEDLLQLRIPLPPLPEQQRIAAILARADRLRRLRRYALELSEGYLQAVFVEMFGEPLRNPKGWPIFRFDQVCESRLGKMLDAKQQTGKHTRPYLRNVNIQWGKVDLSDVQEMDFAPDERAMFRLRRGDVLICEGGEVGRTAIWNDELPECYYQKALHRARPKPSLALPEFILWLMRHLAESGGLGDFTSQVTIAHLTGDKLKTLEFALPPLSLQQEFAHIARKHERLRAQQREALRQAEQLFDTLLDRAFRREL
jgi:type I restriction enzyme S subunit